MSTVLATGRIGLACGIIDLMIRTHAPHRALRGLLGGALIMLLAVGFSACSGLPVYSVQGAPYPTGTPNVVYVTATPEGYQPPTETPYLVYVTPTPSPTRNVIYVTATPVAVGPFHPTETGAAPSQPPPTLDLRDVTPLPPAINATPTPTRAPTATPVVPSPREGALYADRLGIDFISSAQHATSPERFGLALDAGAGWDRFAIYWNDIEPQAGRYDWTLYDPTVRNDVIYGLRTDAILLGMPDFYADANRVPNGIYEPVFSDGTDTPGSGKNINPNNMWAAFVYATVSRYRPGGVLAAQEGWPEGAGVRVWEIWNEPDFSSFWQGSVADYARLLKVAYLAVRQADPDAQVMMGGILYYEKPSFIYQLLDQYRDDPQPVEGRYPFDIVALHAYQHPSAAFYLLQTIQALLAVHGLSDVPVWINESGVPVWDDYPGPTWATQPDQRLWRATMQEQAAYLIQNAAFSFLGSAAKLFHFQLYDDCGNQPRGTTFPPHDGSLCAGGAVCWGDALGLVRNQTTNVCFNQSPQAGTTRPAYDAYRVVADVFGSQPFVPITGYLADGFWRVIFARPGSGEIITVLWDESGQARQVVIAARSGQATLIADNGARQSLAASGGFYTISLDPATNQNQPPGMAFQYMIGGPPVILIEQNPEPIVSVLPLLDDSQTTAFIRWQSSRPQDIVQYEVYYRDVTDPANPGDWVRWIVTDAPGSGLFTPGPDRSYEFFARGQKVDGSWTPQAFFAQAWTTIR